MEIQFIEALKKNADSLIEEWVSLVKTSTKNYQSASEDEIRNNIKRHMQVIIEVFENQDYSELNEFLENLADKRSKMDFDIKETLFAFLNGQTVLLRFLDSIRDKENIFCTNCREITDCFNKTQILYSNIFQSKRLEKTERSYLREIEHKDLRLSSLTDVTADAVIGLDANLNIRSWNRGAEVMYQYRTNEILGKPLAILVPKELLNNGELQSLEMITRRSGFIKNYQTERIRKDGKVLIVNISCTLLKDNDGKDIGFSTIHHDLTEMIQLEQEIRSQERYLSSVVDYSMDAIIGLDLNDNIVSWNKGAENIFGYTKEEVIGKNLDILFTPEAKKSGELKRINEELNKAGFIKSYEGERITKSGKYISTSLTKSLIRDKNNKIIGSSAILRDITEYEKLKMQMSHSEKLSVVGQLTAGIAHEVGNPLTSISSLIQVLTRTAQNEDLTNKLNLIKKQTDRITKLIRDLVSFSQPSDFRIKPTDINGLIKEAISIIKYDNRAQNCHFDIQLAEKLPLTDIPEDQVQQVIINILLNALDAAPPENGKISIHSLTRNGTINVKIKDNGKGIPLSIIDKIFNPFFTTKGVGKGTGLGLWVSYGIIENIRGKILVDSKMNSGSTFTIEIPIIR
ncbi:hypothetical protein AMJ80_07300 [bacterium SM23_31]|nr:MAG: hypothetical protein AMJ80_07300 [bacterium SM23_31]